MSDRLSSLDGGYQAGMLSLFPDAIDDRDILFQATNNAATQLRQTLTYNAQIIIVDDTTAFPDKGELRVGPAPGESGQYELIYYNNKTRNTFQELKRGFAGSQVNYWPANNSWVSNAVFAEHHNALKDAIVNIELDLGLQEDPDPDSLNGILKDQEVRFLAPKPLFRAYPIKGPPPLKVRFQNFTTGTIARFLWDFGDGGTSLERSPVHEYLSEGQYSVKLNVISTTGAQGIATKKNYILVSSEEAVPFFYVESIDNPYSLATADDMSTDPKEFIFVDQTDGDVVQRNWIFGDGNTHTEEDPDVHQISHIYAEPGEYVVTELVQFANGRLKRVQLPDPLIVL
jgi:PKD repeat protein